MKMCIRDRDLGMAPDEHGEVRAPAWLYEGVLRDLARNGQTGNLSLIHILY